YLPFYTSFTSQANGIGAVVSNEGITVPATRPIHAFLFWGPLFVVAIPFVVARLIAARDRITTSLAAISAAPAAAVVVGWVLLYAYERVTESTKLGSGAGGLATQIADRGSAWFTAAFIAAVLAGSISALWLEVTARDRRAERESVIFALALIATAMLLILGTEFFY